MLLSAPRSIETAVIKLNRFIHKVARLHLCVYKHNARLVNLDLFICITEIPARNLSGMNYFSCLPNYVLWLILCFHVVGTVNGRMIEPRYVILNLQVFFNTLCG